MKHIVQFGKIVNETLYAWRTNIRVFHYDGVPCNCQQCTVRRVLVVRAKRKPLASNLRKFA